MPPIYRRGQRELLAGFGDGWTMALEFVTAIGVWAAIGYGLDRLLGTWPVFFVIGAVVGNAAGIYILYRRYMEMDSRARRGPSGTGPV